MAMTQVHAFRHLDEVVGVVVRLFSAPPARGGDGEEVSRAVRGKWKDADHSRTWGSHARLSARRNHLSSFCA